MEELLDKIANEWREDYKPQWKTGHVLKWNTVLVALGAKREKYNIPDDVKAMSAEELERRGKQWGYEGRWADVWKAYQAMDKDETESEQVQEEKRLLAVSGPGPIHDEIVKLKAQVAQQEKDIDELHAAVESTADAVVETDARVDAVRFELDAPEVESNIAEVVEVSDSDREPSIPNVPTNQTEANALEAIIIKYAYVEDFGADVNPKDFDTYRSYSWAKIMGGGGLWQGCPQWLKDAWKKLNAFYDTEYMRKVHAWSIISNRMRQGVNGAYFTNRHGTKNITEVPYGTYRQLVQTLQKDKFGNTTLEVVPDTEEREQVLDYRREQLAKYRNGDIDVIDWKPPFEYTVIHNDAQWKAYWTDENKEKARAYRRKVAAQWNA